MNKQEFETLVDGFVAELGSDMWAVAEQRWKDTLPNARWWREPDSEHPFMDGFLVQWETGGWEGGSCWGAEAEPYSTGERGEMSLLSAFLSKHFPKLSLLDYQALLGEIQQAEWTQTEWYGNSTDYRAQWIGLTELHAFLRERGYLDKAESSLLY